MIHIIRGLPNTGKTTKLESIAKGHSNELANLWINGSPDSTNVKGISGDQFVTEMLKIACPEILKKKQLLPYSYGIRKIAAQIDKNGPEMISALLSIYDQCRIPFENNGVAERKLYLLHNAILESGAIIKEALAPIASKYIFKDIFPNISVLVVDDFELLTPQLKKLVISVATQLQRTFIATTTQAKNKSYVNYQVYNCIKEVEPILQETAHPNCIVLSEITGSVVRSITDSTDLDVSRLSKPEGVIVVNNPITALAVAFEKAKISGKAVHVSPNVWDNLNDPIITTIMSYIYVGTNASNLKEFTNIWNKPNRYLHNRLISESANDNVPKTYRALCAQALNKVQKKAQKQTIRDLMKVLALFENVSNAPIKQQLQLALLNMSYFQYLKDLCAIDKTKPSSIRKSLVEVFVHMTENVESFIDIVNIVANIKPNAPKDGSIPYITTLEERVGHNCPELTIALKGSYDKHLVANYAALASGDLTIIETTDAVGY